MREGAASATLQRHCRESRSSRRSTCDLQRYIDSIWPAGVRGAMVAMTPNGEIRALYSAPNFDPNHFVGGISSAEWRKLNNDPAKPLLNRAIQGPIPARFTVQAGDRGHGAEARDCQASTPRCRSPAGAE